MSELLVLKIIFKIYCICFFINLDIDRLKVSKTPKSRAKSRLAAVKIPKNLFKLLKSKDFDFYKVKKIGKRFAISKQDLVTNILFGR